jgi:hypothetical protein
MTVAAEAGAANAAAATALTKADDARVLTLVLLR